MHFGWTEEETMWRRSVREFAQKKIAPRVREIDSNNRIPDDIVKGMTDMGLWAPTVSEAVRRPGHERDHGHHRRRGARPRRDQPGAAGVVPGGGELGLHL